MKAPGNFKKFLGFRIVDYKGFVVCVHIKRGKALQQQKWYTHFILMQADPEFTISII